MIAGDTNQRNFSYPVPDIPKSDWTGNMTDQAFLRQAALGFNCLNYATTPEGSLYRHFLPDKAYLDANCKDGVRFELMFPSCWNGQLDSPDHKSHVAYPSEVMTGTCPEGFNTRLVSLFYETIWNTYEFVGVNGEFVISNGDPTGLCLPCVPLSPTRLISCPNQVMDTTAISSWAGTKASSRRPSINAPTFLAKSKTARSSPSKTAPPTVTATSPFPPLLTQTTSSARPQFFPVTRRSYQDPVTPMALQPGKEVAVILSQRSRIQLVPVLRQLIRMYQEGSLLQSQLPARQ